MAVKKFSFYNRPMQKIGDTTTMSLFIQNLLASTPLPIFDTVTIGQYVFNGNYYIYNDFLIECTKSGYLGLETTDPLYPSNSLYPENDLFPSNGVDGAEYKKLEKFDFGKNQSGITYTYTPSCSYYDSETHKQLGKYLRCIRDIYDINYMPFYNCFNQQTLPNINGYFNGNFVYVVPILFNQTYTVSYQSNQSVIINPQLYKEVPFEKITNNGDLNMEKINALQTQQIYNGRGYLDYIKISADITDGSLYAYQKYLYLIIQSNVALQSLSVVEGSYSPTNNVTIGNDGESYNMNRYSIVNDFDTKKFDTTSMLQLLDTTNRDKSYAFSNRLVEGLLRFTINSQDENAYNIGRVQEKLGLERDNIWQNKIQSLAFTDYMATQGSKFNYYNYLDINGNIDKDIEYYLFGNNISADI